MNPNGRELQQMFTDEDFNAPLWYCERVAERLHRERPAELRGLQADNERRRPPIDAVTRFLRLWFYEDWTDAAESDYEAAAVKLLELFENFAALGVRSPEGGVAE